MATYFLDTSAIVKSYVPEQGQSFILTICDPSQGHDLYISQAALVEVVASICRKAHEKSITTSERDTLIDTFRQDTQNTYSVSGTIGYNLITNTPMNFINPWTAPIVAHVQAQPFWSIVFFVVAVLLTGDEQGHRFARPCWAL